MADETTETQAQTGDATGEQAGAEATGQTTGAGTGQQTGGDAGRTAEEKRFTQAELDKIVRDRLADEKKRAAKQAEEEKAKAAGEYQKLYEQERAGREAAEAAANNAKLDIARVRIGAKHGLPEDLAELLRGTTEEELEAHAKRLASTVIAKSKVGGADANAGNTNQTSSGNVTANIRQAMGYK